MFIESRWNLWHERNACSDVS